MPQNRREINPDWGLSAPGIKPPTGEGGGHTSTDSANKISYWWSYWVLPFRIKWLNKNNSTWFYSFFLLNESAIIQRLGFTHFYIFKKYWAFSSEAVYFKRKHFEIDYFLASFVGQGIDNLVCCTWNTYLSKVYHLIRKVKWYRKPLSEVWMISSCSVTLFSFHCIRCLGAFGRLQGIGAISTKDP